MKVSTRNIKIIKDRLKKLYTEFNIECLGDDFKVEIGDERVDFGFPDDHFDDIVSVEDFLLYTEDLDNLKKESDSTVRMGKIRQTILIINGYQYDCLAPIITYDDDLINLSIVHRPLLIGFVASKEGIYNEDFGISPCSLYTAVELRYKGDKNYSKDEEDQLILRFIYHIAAKYDLHIEIGEFAYWEDWYDENKPEDYCLNESALMPYSKAMEYYSRALAIEDLDIQFHYLYKIIEHYSPVVSRKVAYEKLNQKLDSLSVVKRDYEYLNSLLDLAGQYQKSLKDPELCKTVLLECVDITSIFSLLPPKVKKSLTKKYAFKESDISKLKDSTLDMVKVELGTVIYNTRNRIVHAKSNWKSSDDACFEPDMADMNEFMKALAQCLIVWNGRQPEEFRI